MFKESLFKNTLYMCQVRKKFRSVTKGEFVQCYRNLQKAEFFSVMALRGKHKNKVVSYAKSIIIKTPVIVIQKAGYLRANKERTRNVHAFIRGYISDMSNDSGFSLPEDAVAITYNPFKHPCFFDVETGKEISKSDMREFALLHGSNVYLFGKKNQPEITG